ncbi:conjugative transposon protein TraN [Sphingobacterium sp. JB170]|uniref:conjugative transposon protein TraN n=1 Tax=Sphingobacterium sp. JB170 TaxID=1434842 RepID=UPI00097F3046|nr:conjugative transposon protein TraN [Sphingobacterium sp. JB170]SJN22341.1 Conjugative transposon protein TraN [Sphingobacterium sp. JB170]
MKNLLIILTLLLAGIQLNAQENAGTYREELPDIMLDSRSSLHLISPQPIRYVDISTHEVVGDLAEPNVLRLKWVPDTAQATGLHSHNLGVVTVIGEDFIAQYNLHLIDGAPEAGLATGFDILPHHTRPIHTPVELTTPELRSHALSLLSRRRPVPIRKASTYGIRAELNSVYTVGNLVLLDITYRNSTNLSYDIDELRFKIEDKKITKATNVQSIEIKPIWQLYPHGSFRKSYRNIYVLKKATFPSSKVLNVELSEKQISGRTITLKIRYGDILNADSF